MALSMDEQRVLAEIERRLAAEDPGLAACLTSFRRPGPATVLRSPRARIIGSLFTVLLVTMVSLMVYAMIPFRTHVVRTSVTTTTVASPTHAVISAAGTGARSSSAGGGSGSRAGSGSPKRSTATQGTTQGASPKAGSRSASTGS
ncbi:MAG: DUF3040 domain-containing protein [Streptosporangiaceae bacterium]|nr:DUF3040 domain-containing protein [Streptosporangiaceae bacterium]